MSTETEGTEAAGLDPTLVDDQIDAWVEATKALTGTVVEERKPWLTEVTADAIRHFAHGTDDDNPLWLDADRAARGRFETVVAPPAFIFAHRYPILHGAPMKAPLASLIGGVETEFYRPIRVGDRLHSEPRQKDFFEKRSKDGRRLNFVISEVTYRNQEGEVVAQAEGTMIMATQVGLQKMMEHEIPYRSEDDLRSLEATWRNEYQRGAEPLHFEDVDVGTQIPEIVRGPLTIGDMVAWNAAIGPSYKAGRRGYLDLTNAMHTAMFNPITGFPVKYSMQHEDVHLAAGRGMPAPFDNGVMRFAWVAPLVTNWMGEAADLKRLKVSVRRPGLYGDLVAYSAKVTNKNDADATVTLEIAGTTRPGGQVGTIGEAVVALPRRRS